MRMLPRVLWTLFTIAPAVPALLALNAPWRGTLNQWIAVVFIAMLICAALYWLYVFSRGGFYGVKEALKAREARFAIRLSPRDQNITLAVVATVGLLFVALFTLAKSR